jgi:hypothetical protein
MIKSQEKSKSQASIHPVSCLNSAVLLIVSALICTGGRDSSLQQRCPNQVARRVAQHMASSLEAKDEESSTTGRSQQQSVVQKDPQVRIHDG